MSNYRLHPQVRWAVQRTTVLVSDGRGEACTLLYPEAAVWDLFSRGYAVAKVVTLLSHIAMVSEEESHTIVREAIARWAASGLLEQE